MRILYLGDIHARTNELGSVVQSADATEDTIIVQVGDFGFGFPDKNLEGWIEKRAYRNQKGKHTTPIYTCGGNHDNWDQLYDLQQQQQSDIVELYPNSKCYYVHRGAIVKLLDIEHLFLGGAYSTDKYRRVSGRDWWNREEPSYQEFEKFFKIFDEQKPNTVITHDAPTRVKIYRQDRDDCSTVKNMENVYLMSEHRPEFHYFGHHHMLESWDIEGTKFSCCGLHGEYYERQV